MKIYQHVNERRILDIMLIIKISRQVFQDFFFVKNSFTKETLAVELPPRDTVDP